MQTLVKNTTQLQAIFSSLRTWLACEAGPVPSASLLRIPANALKAEQNPWRGLRQSLGEHADNADISWLYALWVWHSLRANAYCVPALDKPLQILGERLLAGLAAAQDGNDYYCEAGGAALDRLFMHLQTWGSDLGPAGDKFLQRLDDLLASLDTAANHSESLQAVANFNAAADRELTRAERLAERMQAAEQGNIKAAHARHQVATWYNQQVAGQRLPEPTLQFITDALVPSLQYHLINAGEQAPEWVFWTKLLRLIVWSLNPEKTPEDKQSLFDKGPAIITQLERAAPPHTASAEYYQDFVRHFSGQIIALMQGQPLEGIKAEVMAQDDSAQLLQQLHIGAENHQFVRGDWLEFECDENTYLRCQFVLQVPGTDQLLFVNRNGHKTLQKSAAQISACLEAGIAREIPPTPVFSAAVNSAMAHLQSFYRSQQQCREEAETQARERLARQEQDKLAAQREQASKRRAEAKARAEAARLAERQHRQQAERQRLAKREQAAQNAERARRQLESLTLGTWADLSLPERSSVRCKLAVNMRSTGKYIFVDRVGSKVAELQYEQLLDMLLAERATFYQPEQGFESRLENIVRGLRKTD